MGIYSMLMYRLYYMEINLIWESSLDLTENHEPTKASTKKCGVIKSYAANTN